jgi:hypothetical protein
MNYKAAITFSIQSTSRASCDSIEGLETKTLPLSVAVLEVKEVTGFDP